MPYDLAAMRADFRFYLDDRTPVIADIDVRDKYLNPVARDWIRRFERRPGFMQGTFLTDPGVRVTQIGAGEFVEHVTQLISGREEGLQRDEFLRLRFLQETEGATGRPRQFGYARTLASGLPLIEVALYPIPDDFYELRTYGLPLFTPLAGDTSALPLDPISARYVTRLAAYRAAIDLRRARTRILAIIQPLPEWARAQLNLQWLFEDKPWPKSDTVFFQQEPPRA
jgi:hypothetical protein